MAETVVVSFVSNYIDRGGARKILADYERVKRGEKQIQAEQARTTKQHEAAAKKWNADTLSMIKSQDVLASRVTSTSKSIKSMTSDISLTTREMRSSTSMLGSLGGGLRSARGHVDNLGDGFRRTDRHLFRFNASLSALGKTAKLLKWPILFAGAGLAAQLINALASAAIGLVGSLAPLSGALVAYPALLGAAAQGFVTFKLAFKGMDDALKNMEDPEKFAEAMKKLTPVQREFVLQMKESKKALDSLSQSAAKGLLPGLTRALKEITGNKGLMGVLRSEIESTGRALGGLATRFSKAMESTARIADLKTIMAGNRAFIVDLGTGLGGLADALRHVMVAAQPFISWIGDMIAKFGQWVAKSAEAGRESGKLAAFFDRSKASLQLWGRFLKELAEMLGRVASAAKPLGDVILKALTREMENVNRVLDTPAGFKRLRDWFLQMRDPVFEMARLVRDLGKAMATVGSDPASTRFVEMIRTDLLPAFTSVVTSTMRSLGPYLIDLGRAFSQLFQAIGGANGPLVMMTKAITGFLEIIVKIAQSFPGGTQMLSGLISTFAILKGLKFGATILGLKSVYGWLLKIAGVGIGGGLMSMLAGGRGAAGAGAMMSSVPPRFGGPGAGGGWRGAVSAYGGQAAGMAGLGLLAGGQMVGGQAGSWMSYAGAGAMAGSIMGLPGAVAGALAAVLGKGIGEIVKAIRGASERERAATHVRVPQIGGQSWDPKIFEQRAPTGRMASLPSFDPRRLAATGADKAMERINQATVRTQGATARLIGSINLLKQAYDRIDAAKMRKEDAESALEWAKINEKAAKMSLDAWEKEHKDRSKWTEQEKLDHRSLTQAYKDAVRDRKRAQDEMKASNEELRKSNQAAADQETRMQSRLKETADAYRKKGQALRNSITDTKAEAAAVAANAREFANAMDTQARKLRGVDDAAADYARTAADLARELGRIPTDKEIRLKMEADKALKDAKSLLERLGKIKNKSVRISVTIYENIVRQYSGGVATTPGGGGRCGNLSTVCHNGRWCCLDYNNAGKPVYKNCYGSCGGHVGGRVASLVARGLVGGAVAAGRKVLKAASGMRVPGGMSGQDTVPAMLAPGEFVVTDSGERILEQMTGVPGVLDWLQGVQKPHMAAGGGRVDDLLGAIGMQSGGSVRKKLIARMRRIQELLRYPKKLTKKRVQALRKELRQILAKLQKESVTAPVRPEGAGEMGPFDPPFPPGTTRRPEKLRCAEGCFPWGGLCWCQGDLEEFFAWMKAHGIGSRFDGWCAKYPKLCAILGYKKGKVKRTSKPGGPVLPPSSYSAPPPGVGSPGMGGAADAPPPGGVGPYSDGNLIRSLWDEAALARAYGAYQIQTHNKSSTLPSGGPSDHARWPSHALDAMFSPATGTKNPKAYGFFRAMMGRPGIHYAILGGSIWSTSRGLHPYGESSSHADHVHVSGFRRGGFAAGGRSDLSKTLRDEARLARMYGAYRIDGYNPSSLLPSGAPSEHAVYPAKALDAFFKPPTGVRNRKAYGFFSAMVGRAGIKYAILGDRIWSKARGYNTYSPASAHAGHVHVSALATGGRPDRPTGLFPTKMTCPELLAWIEAVSEHYPWMGRALGPYFERLRRMCERGGEFRRVREHLKKTMSWPPARFSRQGGRIGFARGGMVRDTVPAMLAPGEVVLNAGHQALVSRMLGGPSDGGAGEFLAQKLGLPIVSPTGMVHAADSSWVTCGSHGSKAVGGFCPPDRFYWKGRCYGGTNCEGFKLDIAKCGTSDFNTWCAAHPTECEMLNCVPRPSSLPPLPPGTSEEDVPASTGGTPPTGQAGGGTTGGGTTGGGTTGGGTTGGGTTGGGTATTGCWTTLPKSNKNIPGCHGCTGGSYPWGGYCWPCGSGKIGGCFRKWLTSRKQTWDGWAAGANREKMKAWLLGDCTSKCGAGALPPAVDPCEEDPCSSADCPEYDPDFCEGGVPSEPPIDGGVDGGTDTGGDTGPSLSERISSYLAPTQTAARIAQIQYERLGLQQRLSGLYETGGAARAEFIKSTIIPSLQAELTAIEEAIKLAAGDPEVLRQLQEARESKQNEILQAQLDAMEAIKSNTGDLLKAFQGSLGFEFGGGQRWTDLLGMGVGA